MRLTEFKDSWPKVEDKIVVSLSDLLNSDELLSIYCEKYESHLDLCRASGGDVQIYHNIPATTSQARFVVESIVSDKITDLIYEIDNGRHDPEDASEKVKEILAWQARQLDEIRRVELLEQEDE